MTRFVFNVLTLTESFGVSLKASKMDDASLPSARKLAYQALYDILEKKAYANLTLQHVLKEYPLNGPESRLLTELVYGVLRKYNYLLWIISRLSTYSLNKIHPSVHISHTA
jgi:16S rRNA (cytosine967-C5)-methyltransferase